MNHLEQLIIEKHKIKEQVITELKKESFLGSNPCSKDKEYMNCVYDILAHEKCKKMSNFIQHGSTTTLDHCIKVSYVSYKICKKFGYNYRAAARGGLLHDMFLYDWHTYKKETGNRLHGLTHPKVAHRNASRYFKLTDMEADIILKHMWPLTIVPPKYIEGYVVMYADKYCTVFETIHRLKERVLPSAL